MKRPLLRPLTGVALLFFRAFWIALFAYAVVSTTVLAYRATAQDAALAAIRYRAGVHILVSPAGGFFVTPFSREARAKGIGRERLVAVDGRHAATGYLELMRQLDGPENSPVVLQLAADDGTQHVVSLKRRSANIGEAYAGSGLTQDNLGWFFFLSASLFDWSLLAVALLLFVRRPGDPVGALLSIGMVVLVVNLALVFPNLRNTQIAPTIGTAMVLSAILIFPDARPVPRWSAAGGMVVALYVLSAIARLFDAPFDAITLVLLPGAYAAAVGVAVVRYRALPRGTRRQQMKFALLGFALAALFELVAVALRPTHLPVLSEAMTSWLIVLSNLAESLSAMSLAGGLLVSLLRYRLYDAETAISRSVMFGALTVAILAIFAGSEKVIELLGEQYFGHEMGVLAGGMGAAIAAAMIAPLHHRVGHWAEHRFQGGLVHLRQGLPLLLGDLRETAAPAALADALLERVEHGVRARHGGVLVGAHMLALRDIDRRAAEEWLARWTAPTAQPIDCDRVDPLFPVRVRLNADGTGHVGWLLLGPRPDGSFYGKDERETLVQIADPAARALAIALERQRRDAEDRAAYARLIDRDAAREREVAGLRALVERLVARLGPA